MQTMSETARKAPAWSTLARCAIAAILLLACGGKASDGGGTSSETNWLARCAEDADCDEGSCLCGVCTMPCQGDGECSDVDQDATCLSASMLGCGAVVAQAICGTDDTPFVGEASDGGVEPRNPSVEVDASTLDASTGGRSNTSPPTDAGPDAPVPVANPDPAPPTPTTPPSVDFMSPELPPGPDGPPRKLDLLVVVDNSRSMADKQAVFAQALPDLVIRLTQTGLSDIHLGIITTSLGGYGAAMDCGSEGEQNVDMAHLLGSLPRVGGNGDAFLSWSSGSDTTAVTEAFADQVRQAGEFGCGWEASLEAWYRFLIEPYPYTQVVRQPCNSSDTNDLCAGPETDSSGNRLVDTTILEQRAQFLRPDSAVVIAMLSDENDCSFVASGQSWVLAQTVNSDGGFNAAFKASSACSDPALGPNHECCTSCGVASVPAGCPTATTPDGQITAVGCESGRYYASDGLADHPNLRCFQQKRRFGVDYLYPVTRYINALRSPTLCAFANDLDPTDDAACPGGVGVVTNPLYPGGEELGEGEPRRTGNEVFIAGLLGVPWQDVAISADPSDPLVLRSSDPNAEPNEALNWNWLVGSDPTSNTPIPDDPFMVESITPRSGTNPGNGEAIAPTTADARANSINGHEWNTNGEDLQYACTSALAEPRTCLTEEEFFERLDSGEQVPICECTWGDTAETANPVCQTTDGQYGLQQQRFKAYPSLRQLQVMSSWGPNAIVGSICTKDEAALDSADYGYRPFVDALASRLSSALGL